jgi:putative FmdB family regulatory protein
MPTYEYECGHCSHRFDLRQRFDDEPEAVCPQCQGRARRVFHPALIIYKGSGFYVTDSRKHDTPEKSKSEVKSGEAKPTEAKPTEARPTEAKVNDS